MPSLMNRIVTFARSPQGKRLTASAKRFASDPKNRQRFEEMRKRLAQRRGR